MSTKKKKIKSQPKDGSTSSPQDMEEPKEVGQELDEVEKRDLRDLAEDIIVAHDTRVKIVGEIIEDTHQMMANFKMKREQMAQELQKLLAKGESLRKKDFERMMTDIIDTHAKREEEVKEMLEDFRAEEEMVAEKLRGLLTKGEEVRIRDFKRMMAEIKQGQEKRIQATNESVTDQLRRMQEEVHTMLDNFKTERQSVAGAWHEMLGLFHGGSEAPRVVSNPGTGPDPDEYQQNRQEYDKKNKIKKEIV
ncbi:MAG: hypothetical protein Q8N56_03425 [bacterium]|nr:hypothetical protein [bacterium]